MKIKKKCYVIMPFSDLGGITEYQWTEIYTQLFKPAVEEARLGYTCERSELRNGAFTKDIVQNLKHAYVVLADITHLNANVMWELGVRHALSKRSIMVARHDVMKQKIISDMSTYGVISYDPTTLTKVNEFKSKIKDILKGIEKTPERSDSPVFDFLIEEMKRAIIEKDKLVSNLTSLLSELFYNMDLAQKILAGTVHVDLVTTTLQRFQNNAVNYLRTTNYLPANEMYYKIIKFIADTIDSLNRRIDLVFLDKRLGKDSSHPEQIKDMITPLINNIKRAIEKTNEFLSSAKQETIVKLEPPILFANEEQKKLI